MESWNFDEHNSDMRPKNQISETQICEALFHHKTGLECKFYSITPLQKERIKETF